MEWSIKLFFLKNKRLSKILFLSLAVSINACANDTASDSIHKHANSIKIYKGLYLGSLLNEPQEIDSIKDAGEVLNKPWYTGIVVRNKANDVDINVNSCRDYFTASKQGMEPAKEFERSAYFEFSIMCMAAKDTSIAKPALTSYINDFLLNKDSPKLLPKEFSFSVSSIESKKSLSNKRLIFWSDVNAISNVENITNESAVFKHAGVQQELSFVAKADFNGDEIEDLLILSKDSVVGGSFTSIRLFIITRLSTDSNYVLLKKYNFK